MKKISFSFNENWARAFFSSTNNDINLVDVGIHDFASINARQNCEITPNATFHFIISGKGYLNLFQKHYSLSSGDIFYIPPYAEKSYYPDKSTPWKYCFFTLKGADVENFFLKAGFSKQNPTFHIENNAQKIATEFDEMANNILYNNNTPSELLAMSSLYKICALIASERHISYYLPNAHHTFSEHIKYHLAHHFHEPTMSVKKLCSEMFFSQSYLTKIFKKENGITIQEYMTSLRINSACSLLKETDMTVRQIAEYVGYVSTIAFSRMFKKLMGCNPSEYRENFTCDT